MMSAARPDPWITTTGVSFSVASATVCRVLTPPSSTSITTGTCTPAAEGGKQVMMIITTILFIIVVHRSNTAKVNGLNVPVVEY